MFGDFLDTLFSSTNYNSLNIKSNKPKLYCSICGKKHPSPRQARICEKYFHLV